MNQEFDFPFYDAPPVTADPHPYTIEWRHILAAIPGDTNRQKLDWVRAHVTAMQALGEIEAVLDKDVRAGDEGYVLKRIAEIVAGVE